MMIATDGTLDPEATAGLVERMYREGDEPVLVFTAVNFPREFLSAIGHPAGVQDVVDVTQASGHALLGMASPATAAERMAEIKEQDSAQSESLPAVMETTAGKRIAGVLASLGDRSIPAESVWRATEEKTARTIMETADAHDCDVIVIGRRGYGRFEGLLGSTGTKLVRHAPMHVLVVNPEKE